MIQVENIKGTANFGPMTHCDECGNLIVDPFDIVLLPKDAYRNENTVIPFTDLRFVHMGQCDRAYVQSHGDYGFENVGTFLYNMLHNVGVRTQKRLREIASCSHFCNSI